MKLVDDDICEGIKPINVTTWTKIISEQIDFQTNPDIQIPLEIETDRAVNKIRELSIDEFYELYEISSETNR